MKTNKFKGFTLIELLVVITIIGVLSSLLVVNYMGVRARSRDAQRKSDLRQIQSAFELYRSDAGFYPATMPACGAALTYTTGGVTSTYVQKFPCDPTNAGQFVYSYQRSASTVTYTLGACIENVNDSQKDSSNNPPNVDNGTSITSCAGGTSNWSYTLYSP